MVPGAFDTDDGPDLVRLVEQRIASLPGSRRHDVERTLDALASPIASALFGGPLLDLDESHRLQRLEALSRSRLAIRRRVVHGLRTLILHTWYATPFAASRIGAAGLRWTAPLPGLPRPGEAVLRVADPGTWRPAAATGAPRTTAVPDHVRADVCVIGSGAGGSVVACRLAEAGLAVVVLEEGGPVAPDTMPATELDAMTSLYADGGLRTTDDAAISLLQGRCEGGGTTVNWLLVLRPPPWVLGEWEQVFGMPALGPALDAMEQELGAATVPEDAHSAQNRILMEGCARLGWRHTVARISAHDCVRAGRCGLGCPYGARRGARSVFLERARRAGARIVPHARADRIEGAAPKRVRATVTRDGNERSVTVEADRVVVAAGAVGTPALLQRSGLGNADVGRHLRLHPTTATFGMFDRAIHGDVGIPQSVVCTQFHAPGDGGFWIECPPAYPGLAGASLPGFGEAHAARMRDHPRMAAAIVLVRDEGDGGRVRVGSDGSPRIRYRLDAPLRRRIADGLAATARIQLAGGAAEVRTLHVDGPTVRTHADAAALARLAIEPCAITLFSAHVNGTCRMGADRSCPATPEGRLRGATGIWVADGSLFPTAPAANPQLAIYALASLVAESIT